MVKRICILGGGRMGLMRYKQLVGLEDVKVSSVVDLEAMRERIEGVGAIFKSMDTLTEAMEEVC